MIKQSFSLKEIARITGIRANRLRIWKKRYGILQPIRTEGKEHRFDSDTLRYIMKISKLLEQGYRISELLEMESSEMDERIESLLLYQDRAYLKKLSDDALQSLLELEPYPLEIHYRKALERFGFRSTMDKLLFPLLRKVGNLWEIGTIHSVHEHLLSNFIRQKLMVASDLADADRSQSEITLFLPDQELHEIPLLYLQYLLLEKSQNPVFLGGSVPYQDLDNYLSKRTPAAAVAYLTYTGNMDLHVERMPEVASKFENIPFYFAVPPDFYDDFVEQIDQAKTENLIVYSGLNSLVEAVIDLGDGTDQT